MAAQLYCQICRSMYSGSQCTRCNPVPYVNQGPPQTSILRTIPEGQGAWQCPHCRSVIPAHITTCSRCSAQIQGTIPPAGELAWSCECGYRYNQFLVCYSCKRPKPSTATIGSQCQTHWNCAHCQTQNISMNRYCNSCGQAWGSVPAIETLQVQCTLQVSASGWVCEYCRCDRNGPASNSCQQCQGLNAVGRLLATRR